MKDINMLRSDILDFIIIINNAKIRTQGFNQFP